MEPYNKIYDDRLMDIIKSSGTITVPYPHAR